MKSVVVWINFLRFLPHLIIKMLSTNKAIINADVLSYSAEYKIQGGKTFMLLYFLFFNRSFRSLFYYRIGFIKWLVEWLAPGMPTLSIPKSVIIGEGVLLFHSYGTILNAKSIGEHCRIVCNVTLGDKNGDVPTIGKQVEILPGAVITGDVKIGDNCVIGPNAVVYKSVPANCVVVGNPAYILKENGIKVNRPL